MTISSGVPRTTYTSAVTGQRRARRWPLVRASPSTTPNGRASASARDAEEQRQREPAERAVGVLPDQEVQPVVVDQVDHVAAHRIPTLIEHADERDDARHREIGHRGDGERLSAAKAWRFRLAAPDTSAPPCR